MECIYVLFRKHRTLHLLFFLPKYVIRIAGDMCHRGSGGCTVPCVSVARRAHGKDTLHPVATALQAGLFAYGTHLLCEIALAMVT
jgi:hypothetical protein